MKKIDTHCHTTNRFLANSANPDASVKAISHFMKRHQITHTILLATYFPARGTGISNFRMHHWCHLQPHFSMFGSLDYEHYFYQGINELHELAQLEAIKGIKLYTAYQHIDFRSGKFRDLVELAQSYQLPIMFHGGVSYDLWKKLSLTDILFLSDASVDRVEPFKTPRDFAQLAHEYPEVTMIVSHLCKPFFRSMIDVLNQFDNVFTDISGIFDSRRDQDYRSECADIVKRFVSEVGPSKVMFGTDFPVQTHEDSIYFVEQALEQYSPSEKQLVYYGNANRLIFDNQLAVT